MRSSLRITVSSNHITQILFIPLFRVLLDYLYVYVICGPYAYQGFHFEFNASRLFISWLLVFAIIPFAVSRYQKLSFQSTVPYLLIFLAYIPATTMYAYMETPFMLLFVSYFLLLMIFTDILPDIQFKAHRTFDEQLIKAASIIVVFFMLYIWARYAGFRINFNLYEVYEYRRIMRSSNVPRVLAYLLAMTKVLFPALAIWAFSMNRKLICSVLVAAQFIGFFIDGSKSAVFSLVIAFMGFLVLRKNTERVKWLLPILSFGSLVAILEAIAMHSFALAGLIIRRVYFVPAQLNYAYYDFFSQNTPDFFMQGPLRLLGFHSQYSEPIQILIGKVYFHVDQVSANNGLFSDAYANLGILGVFVMPLIIAVFLNVLDACTEGLPKELLVAPLITVSINLLSSSFFTLLLTHGYLVLALTYYFLPRTLPSGSKTAHDDGCEI